MGIYKSSSNIVICGICGGLAEHFGWNPSRVRLAFILASIIVCGLFLYLLLAILMRKSPY